MSEVPVWDAAFVAFDRELVCRGRGDGRMDALHCSPGFFSQIADFWNVALWDDVALPDDLARLAHFPFTRKLT